MAAPNLDTTAIVNRYKASGSYIEVDGIRTFVSSRGRGEPVFCIHGVPTSSFLYRKVLDALAKKGYKGICCDLPGLGLSDRPENFDYTFSAFADFLSRAAGILRLKKFHLVVHDIGGPIGFALAARHPDRILSLTVLNTWIDVVNFKKPLIMRPFEKKGLGEIELKLVRHTTWPLVFKTMGILRPGCVSVPEMNVYVDLLKRSDGGRAFLKIMRRYENSQEFKALCYQAVQDVSYPVQVLWGKKDPALRMDIYGKEIQQLSGVKKITALPSRHFLQEENWLALAEKIVQQAKDLQFKGN